MLDAEYIKVFAPLLFRIADKFFKYVSWAIILSLLSHAQRVTESSALWWLHVIAILIFGSSLLFQTNYIVVRDPSDWNVPEHLRGACRVVQVIGGLTLLFLVSSPFFVLDGIIGDLANVRPR